MKRKLTTDIKEIKKPECLKMWKKEATEKKNVTRH